MPQQMPNPPSPERHSAWLGAPAQVDSAQPFPTHDAPSGQLSVQVPASELGSKHTPATQAPLGQATPQAPQLFGSDAWSLQAPPQQWGLGLTVVGSSSFGPNAQPTPLGSPAQLSGTQNNPTEQMVPSGQMPPSGPQPGNPGSAPMQIVEQVCPLGHSKPQLTQL
jgi:hypothetical protein